MTLYTYTFTAKDFDLPAALRAFAAKAGTAILLYGPAKCRFGRLDAAGTVTDERGEPIDLKPIYEARAFHDAAELRWWNDPTIARCHRTVILREDEKPIAGWEPPHQQTVERNPERTTYLLWGQPSDGPVVAGWSELASARIGRMAVPVAGVPAKGRVQLIAWEYFAEYEPDGNVAVCDERLVKLEPIHAQG